MTIAALVARLGVGPRAGWILIDQAISSLTNLTLSVLVARSVDVNAFGAFTIAYTLYIFVVEFMTAMVLQPLIIRYSGVPRPQLEGAAGSACGLSLVGGLVALLILVVSALALEPLTGGPVIALAVTLPGLLLQNACRYTFFAAGKAQGAALNDLLWGLTQLAVGLVAPVFIGPSPGLFIAIWGVAGSLAGVVGLIQLTVRPRFTTAASWLLKHRDIAPRLVLEFLVESGALNFTLLAVGAISGLAGLAALNAARVLLGPLGVLFLAGSSILVTEGARLRDRQDHRLLSAVRASGLLLTAAAVGWGLALLLMPPELGSALLGESYALGRSVLTTLTLFWGALGAIHAARAGLRILAKADRSLRAQLMMAPVTVLGGVLGARIGGAHGAAAGLALVTVGGVFLWWFTFEGAAREYEQV
ncbi:MAG: hypothetical protein M3198_13655 [Actinomycetota bacterium]|nr:hypothetical protein [Actinomycetota bacterium]